MEFHQLGTETPGTSRLVKKSKHPDTPLGHRIRVAFERSGFRSASEFTRNIYNEDGSPVTRACFTQWCSGLSRPGLDKLEQVARLGKVDLHWLVFGTERDIEDRIDERPPVSKPEKDGYVQIRLVRAAVKFTDDPVTVDFITLPEIILKKWTRKTTDLVMYQIEIDHNGWKEGDCVLVNLKDRDTKTGFKLVQSEICLMAIPARQDHPYVKGAIIGSFREI